MTTKLPIELRIATPADAELLAELGALTMYEAFAADNTPENMAAYVTGAFTPDRLRAELTDPRATFWLAKHGTDVAGYAKLNRGGRKPRLLTGQRAVELQRIYVKNGAQGLGLGRLLLETCLRTARDEGYQTVFLGVWEKNHRARAFYEHLGFARCGWHYFQFGSERQRDFWMQIAL